MEENQELAGLYRRYGLIVERRCARLLGDAAEARDAAHETFARAAQKLPGFRGESERLTWLYRISTNVCLNLLRERRVRGEAWREAVAASRPQHDEPVVVARRSAAQLVAAAEDDVSRELAVLVFVDGMSQGEAATHVGLSRATVNAKLGRFRERARALLEDTP